MNSTDRIDEISLRRWLDEGVDVAPERAVQDALSTIQTTRQRRELALLRRFPMTDVSAAAPRRPAWRLAAVAAVIVLLASGAIAAFQMSPRVGTDGPALSSLVDLVRHLAAPAGTTAGQLQRGDAALREVAGTTSIAAITDLDGSGYEDAASTSYVGAGTPRRFTVAVLQFADDEAAAVALGTILRAADEVSAGTVDGGIGFWNRPPWAEVPSGADGEVIELTGSWVTFGGTSATDSSRAALLLLRREGARISISAGIDPDTAGSAELQAAIESGVRQLAARLADQGD